jgi:hypothetical protein
MNDRMAFIFVYRDGLRGMPTAAGVAVDVANPRLSPMAGGEDERESRFGEWERKSSGNWSDSGMAISWTLLSSLQGGRLTPGARNHRRALRIRSEGGPANKAPNIPRGSEWRMPIPDMR